MKVLVFGASGATGHYVVSQGLNKGYQLTAFVRHPSKLKINNSNLKVCTGDVGDMATVEDAVRNQDVVISTLGASNPFLRNITLIKGVENIVNAMVKQNVRRFMYQSFLGVEEFRNDLGFLMNNIIPLILVSVIKDHEEKEKIILNSNVEATIVRCAMLTDGEINSNYKVGERIHSKALVPFISRASVADFMLTQVANPAFSHKKPRIMNH